ncbi:sensor histidine kinase [Nonomuraea endophytica]|uniref:histidine kinase n=1 Tax=Nonomuraea endophytica TaxID=714136 RepID=A0A7W8EG15_9ACTN|nr:HAMP domain-containing sensor histidine kinase [Nonomuraea endophytica]MBB5078114.1 two-component system sensor histidine kinase MprB [Nonomuraea endophytica]
MKWSSLRARMTLLVTAAVALAVALSAVLCFSIVRMELLSQLDHELEGPPGKRPDIVKLQLRCSTEPPAEDAYAPPYSEQIIYADQSPTCSFGTPIRVTEADLRVARSGGQCLHTSATIDGAQVRVVTKWVAPGVAVMSARRLDRLQTSLSTLAALLAGVAGLGVLGAASAGLLVSRTALRPVGELTRAVEHIATTEDLDTSIPVKGEDEIARLSASFNAMTAALAGSRDRQRQLVADAGHELRTPLTTLRTNIDLLLRSEQTGRQLDPAAKERLLVNVKAQFAELSALVGDLLMLARGDTDHEPHVELAVHEVVKAAAERARLRGAELSTDLGQWFTVGNAASLERAVLNLIDNARKFSENGIEVVLRGGVLTVRDHGPGIPREELPHVFERFWRSPSARALPGSGLGLAIVAQAVAEAGGSVRLDNAPGGGVIATVRLPGSLTPLSSSAKSG